MGNPRTRVDFAILNETDDAREVGWQGVPRRQQGHLTAVHQRMREVDFLGGDPDIHESSGVAHVVQRIAHRFGIAGGIDDQSKEVPVSQCLKFRKAAPFCHVLDGVIDFHRVLAEVEALLIDVQHRDLGIRDPQELDGRQTNRPRPDHQDVLAGLGLSAIDRVAADGQRFYQRQLLERERL